MNASLRALVKGIIDYAGLFPPAKLEMADAVRAYNEYRRGPYAWMLGRMIVPVARLEELERAVEAAETEADWRLSVIAAPASDLTALDIDLERIERFNKVQRRGQPRLAIDSIELKAESASQVDEALDMVPQDLDLFIEIPANRDVRGVIAALAGSDASAKVRTGGASREMFPPAEDLARFIWACAMADVPFKATAGLHHPLPGPSQTVPGAREHGFLNLFAGAIFVRMERITETQLAELLDDDSWASFELSVERIAWRGQSVSVDEIEAGRAEFALSYGSCSFEEPIEDLRQVKLLDGDQAARLR